MAPRKARQPSPIQGIAGHLGYKRTYLDGAPIPDDTALRRPCVRCGLPPTATGADPCIADLPDVAYACCGHGGYGYVSIGKAGLERMASGEIKPHKTFRFVNQTGDAIRQMNADRPDVMPPGWAWDSAT